MGQCHAGEDRKEDPLHEVTRTLRKEGRDREEAKCGDQRQPACGCQIGRMPLGDFGSRRAKRIPEPPVEFQSIRLQSRGKRCRLGHQREATSVPESVWAAQPPRFDHSSGEIDDVDGQTCDEGAVRVGPKGEEDRCQPERPHASGVVRVRGGHRVVGSRFGPRPRP